MSSIKVAYTNSSTVAADLGYLILTADLDGYLKIRTPNSDLINVTKPLSFFTASDTGNYLRWVNPNLLGLEIVNGTFSVGSNEVNFVGSINDSDSFLIASGIFGGSQTQSVNILLNKSANVQYFSGVNDISVFMGQYNNNTDSSTAINIYEYFIYHDSFTSSSGYTHSIFENYDRSHLISLMCDGEFAQTNHSNGSILLNGTYSLGGYGSDPVCGSVISYGLNGEIANFVGIDMHSSATSSVLTYINTDSLYTHFVKSDELSVSARYTDLSTKYTQGLEISSSGTVISGLTANSNMTLAVSNSVNNKFEFYNDGNLKMGNNVGSINFNGIDQYVTVTNPLVDSNSHVIISMSYSPISATAPSVVVGYVEKGNGTFSVHDENLTVLSYSYLIINSI